MSAPPRAAFPCECVGSYSVPISCVRPFRGGGAILVSFTDGGRDIGMRPILLAHCEDVLKLRIAVCRGEAAPALLGRIRENIGGAGWWCGSAGET
jgi:hypothetical protein